MAFTPEVLAIRQRLFDDFEFYAKHAIRIRTKDQRIIPLALNQAQRRLLDAVVDQLERRGFVRLIILKGRQMGSSTFVEAFLYWWVSQRKAQKALVVAHDGPASSSIFQMTRRFHDQCPDALKPHTKYSSKKELVFDVLDSSYMVSTAGGEGIARGETVTAVHLSESGWWPTGSARENHAGLMDAIPNRKGTLVFEESTANGFNQFHEHWQAALRGESLFEPIFLSWTLDDGYRETAPEDFERTPAEEELVRRFDLDNGQLLFRRLKIAEKGPELFAQEFPLCADEAFITSGRPVFHPERIVDWLANSVRPPIARKALEADGEWRDHPRGELECFLPLDPKETYYVGADVGFGVRKDFSVAQVFDSQRRQAAIWRSDRVNSDYFGTVLAAIGRFYNEAQIICERNGPGILTNRVLTKDEAYPWVWQETVVDKVTEQETTFIGFLTSSKSKPLVIGNLQGRIRDREVELYDRTTLLELQSYIVTETGKLEAEPGHHDDCVMALALCDHINIGAFTPITNHAEWYGEIE